jgi:hypothetical protein
MLTAAEYRVEALRCRELASQLPSQKQELSNVLMELAQEYNRAARRVEEWEHNARKRLEKSG